MRSRTPKTGAQRSRGSVAVEYAFLLPALLLFMLGITECGRLFWTYTTLYRATEAAARCGAVNTPLNTPNDARCDTPGHVQTYAVTQAYGLTVTTGMFTAGPTTNCDPLGHLPPESGYQVSANFPFKLLIPWLTGNTLSLTPVSCYPT